MTPRTDIRLCILLIAMGVTATVLAKEADKHKSMSVQVNDAAVRLEPSFLSDVAGTLDYGDAVGVLEEAEGWQRVKAVASPVAGWMHASALTKKEVKLEAGESDANVQASQEELAAGGRGFNQEVEDKFREENKDLDPAYRKLDRLLADPAGRSSLSEIVRFMREGGLMRQPGGGQ